MCDYLSDGSGFLRCPSKRLGFLGCQVVADLLGLVGVVRGQGCFPLYLWSMHKASKFPLSTERKKGLKGKRPEASKKGTTEKREGGGGGAMGAVRHGGHGPSLGTSGPRRPRARHEALSLSLSLSCVFFSPFNPLLVRLCASFVILSLTRRRLGKGTDKSPLVRHVGRGWIQVDYGGYPFQAIKSSAAMWADRPGRGYTS